MSSLRLLPWGCALLGAAPLPPAATPIYPPRTLILFVASWCAPCRAELRQVEVFAAIATPVEVRVTPIDQSSATVAMLRDVPAARIWRSARAIDAFTRQTGSLPFSVMTDANGRPCATHDRALDIAAVLAMRRRCDTPFLLSIAGARLLHARVGWLGRQDTKPAFPQVIVITKTLLPHVRG